ncbi:RelB/DinJ family addiction module antitoxin [Bifidobacterium anseris]|uniref:RelB/DinJ family addiction module antitoxin n=1 Tax=Bifidobacterium anseris TaxID=2020963 RepID=A0A2N5IXK3_9BIFI|nr:MULTISPECIES: type II toxin-antitoxin system RelB/DinJ family antitoxin [Bifidobacterium]PLS26684.1 RelB/DinJ family addiction module antitoxin [Bifidobacterium anseris]
MSMTTVSVRMEDSTKEEFSAICDQIGMNMTTAFNIFAKAVVREHGIPFPVSADPFYAPENMRHLERSIRQLEQGDVSEHELREP